MVSSHHDPATASPRDGWSDSVATAGVSHNVGARPVSHPGRTAPAAAVHRSDQEAVAAAGAAEGTAAPTRSPSMTAAWARRGATASPIRSTSTPRSRSSADARSSWYSPSAGSAGTVISSYYVAFDPSTSRSLVGQILFPSQILGVMTGVGALGDSDFLGNPTATYLNPTLRGLESGVDSVSITGDLLSIDFSADSPGDYVRVILAAGPSDPPPVPLFGPIGAIALAAASTFAGGLAMRRRRRVR